MQRRKLAIGWRRHLTVLAAVALALLPRFACPCQMPAYAGLLGWLGLAFLMRRVYLLPLSAMCLTLAVGGLAVGAKRRRGYGPFTLGLVAAAALMFGKFVVAWPAAVYGGVALLLAASLWNAWPRTKKLRFDPDGNVQLTQ